MDNKKEKCGNCDFSKCNLDMTIRECIEKCGCCNPEEAEKFFKKCCKE